MDKIRIAPSHEGLLTKKVGKAGLTMKNLQKELQVAKREHDVKLEREIVFAENERKWKKK